MQTEEIESAEVARMWPFADLEPFAAFGWEARGGYGDAYQTAQAFAVAARGAACPGAPGCEEWRACLRRRPRSPGSG